MQSLAVNLRSSPTFHGFFRPSTAEFAAPSRNHRASLLFRIQSLQCVLHSSSIGAEEAEFVEASRRGNLVPLHRCIFTDHLTPVVWLRKTTGSVVGSDPSVEIIAKEKNVTIVDHVKGSLIQKICDDPMEIPESLSDRWEPQLLDGLPDTFCGGWVGYFSYDTVRYVEKKKLFIDAPQDDRNLADIHLGLYQDVIVFDHVQKYSSTEEAYRDGIKRLEKLVSKVHDVDPPKLLPGCVQLSTQQFGNPLNQSNMSREKYKAAVLQAKEHILAGDIFQIVLSQRFERRTFADPFEIYRALRVVNPSPYMTYLQNTVVNRPLAGTIRRGKTPVEDEQLEKKLLNDEKQCAEHIMLVDLGRNDVGKVTGELLDHLTCWDALRAALPVGTVSGAPKLQDVGPTVVGSGRFHFLEKWTWPLSLRTMVFPTKAHSDTMYLYKEDTKRKQWVAYLQAGAGIVADSVPDDEQQECENKVAGLARAIDLAESAFCKMSQHHFLNGSEL
ncbi:hypothetical protein L1987_62312 [Smallanthus sonchifolius]|uniref:Uncharacterized protein n=1 Tax=Smallanthus sonchifolius TaxID=185202 RepID=A0ACB9CA36_9ASTR|nr:hypothetical protein L1987_62312 [Smallanthus sonchifolius]